MTPKPVINGRDTTIEDIHRTRKRIASEFGGDINAILDDARKRQAASGRRTVSHVRSTAGAVDQANNADPSPIRTP